MPTPQAADGAADLSFVESVAAEIGPLLASESIVVNKSTVPVGSTRIVQRALRRPDVLVVSNPEFLREGSAVHDFLHPGRIVIGADDQAAAIRVASLYLGVAAPLIVTDPPSAEIIKYASNAFLATKLSFVNAVAAVCESVGADVNDVVLGMGYDPRIGREFLRPGPGWGGSCLPKDTRALLRIADDAGYDFELLQASIDVNEQQLDRVVDKVAAAAGGSLEGVTVAAWGLTFKARTDDLRESPALAVIARLRARGAVVQAYDPTVRGPLPDVDVRQDAVRGLRGGGRARRPHRVGRAALARLRQGRLGDGRPPRRGRPQPPRPGLAGPLRVHVPRRRPGLTCGWWWPAAPASSAASCARRSSPGVTRSSPSTAWSPAGAPTWPPSPSTHGSRWWSTTCAGPSLARVRSPRRSTLVMDLASPASPDDFDRIPLQILAVGSAGTGNLLDLARDGGARFFLASTSEVYGDPLVHPQDESYWGTRRPDRPAVLLRRGQALLGGADDGAPPGPRHRRPHRPDLQHLRPRMRPDDGRVVTNFVVQALSGEPLTVYGDGQQTRSFCYVTDEVAGLLALADHPGPLPGPVNVGNPDESTMARARGARGRADRLVVTDRHGAAAGRAHG